MRRAMGILLLFFSATSALRAATALDFAHPFHLWTQSTIQTLTFINVFLFTLTGGIGFLLVSRENIDTILLKESRTDYLTGLPNRRAFFRRGEKQFAYSVQTQQPISYMVIDIDKFKTINDRFGHDAGDTVLRHFSDLLSEAIRTADLPVRLGGDEFGVLLPGTDYQEALVVAERIIKQPYTIIVEGVRIDYALSIGLGVISREDITQTNFESLRLCGDRALYKAKALGRNQIVCETCPH